MSEEIILQADKVFRWEGPKRKQTLFSARLGRLVLTDQRLLFLSSGKNDVNAKRLIGGAVSPLRNVDGFTSGTQDLDMSALSAKGGLEVPLSAIRSAELRGVFKTMTITYIDSNGMEQSSTFAPKNGGMPSGNAWVGEIERRRP